MISSMSKWGINVRGRRTASASGRGDGDRFGARYRSEGLPFCGRSRASSERGTVRPAKTSTWWVFATAWVRVSAPRAGAAAGPGERASRRARTRPCHASLPRGVPAARPRLRPTGFPHTPLTPRLIIPATLPVRMWVSFLAIDAIIRC